MGRPYKNELRSLFDAYKWAVETSKSDHLKPLWHGQEGKTLIACGSGGSYSAASCAVALHRHYHKSPGYAITPLELEASIPQDQTCNLWFFSATGRNNDIRRALKSASSSELNEITVFCTKKESQLEIDARKIWVERIFSFDTNVAKDGFLATNSLFISTVIMCSNFSSLPASMNKLVQFALVGRTKEKIRSNFLSAAKGCSNVVILHGCCGMVGALDLESKVTESALIASSTADFRNFAHGRHNWLNRFANQTLVIALVGPGEEKLARQTLALVPEQVPQITFPLGENFATAQVLSVYHSIQITDWLGDLHNIDPGRPRIPEFGRELYRLRTPLTGHRTLRTIRQASIHRKVSALGLNEYHQSSSGFWSKRYTTFRRRIIDRKICSIVFDYDGTLISSSARFNSQVDSMSERLVELLNVGIPIGIATGRGDSIQQRLRSIIPNNVQSRVLIGYHNASSIVRLDDDYKQVDDFLDPMLKHLWVQLQDRQIFANVSPIRKYPLQISMRPTHRVKISKLWSEVQALVNEVTDGELKIVCTDHSLDILPKHISKEALVSAICTEFSIEESSVLRIGDNGRWPGNDSELLRSAMGLSVGNVSADPGTCWNLLPLRCVGLQGTLYYLSRLVNFGDGMKIEL